MDDQVTPRVTDAALQQIACLEGLVLDASRVSALVPQFQALLQAHYAMDLEEARQSPAGIFFEARWR